MSEYRLSQISIESIDCYSYYQHNSYWYCKYPLVDKYKYSEYMSKLWMNVFKLLVHARKQPPQSNHPTAPTKLVRRNYHKIWSFIKSTDSVGRHAFRESKHKSGLKNPCLFVVVCWLVRDWLSSHCNLYSILYYLNYNTIIIYCSYYIWEIWRMLWNHI